MARASPASNNLVGIIGPQQQGIHLLVPTDKDVLGGRGKVVQNHGKRCVCVSERWTYQRKLLSLRWFLAKATTHEDRNFTSKPSSSSFLIVGWLVFGLFFFTTFFIL
jgi:hypothetical protein